MKKYEFADDDSLVEFLRENVLTRREAESYLNISRQSFVRALGKGKVSYFKAVGTGAGQVQLFLKSDLEGYKKALETDLRKYNPKKNGE